MSFKQNKPVTKQITVYNKWQKDLLIEVFKEWQDTSPGIKVIRKTAKSITYEVHFHFSTNYRGFADIFWSNIKTGPPKRYN